ncbi:hypothetical protein ACOMICROBIO_NCLOACGD_02991 [Vibrio sp. B1ASS3]|uniref:hypothetical protein n=1 Tax=Vibrio sp. B1ASS3 TaxID=2751176 RepID=UPI001AF17494|nr:hypothetical protein [Vibrio sp. B1ASS3]CAD7815317.1 hypothetical protein ACOMICROBIO_NCLOACGD_02991 [Vibrio sp. B1ASS3]CAE6924908.1 hypothetical protein ACOMICROBIO_NCLOACGD_02991 [Vibrio sp. B1ASS3]
MKNILLILFFCGLAVVCFDASLGYVSIAQSVGDVVTVDGFMNIAGAYGMLLLSICVVLKSSCLLMGGKLPEINWNYVVYGLLLVITPSATYITYTNIQSNIEEYVECEDAREFSLRYSSRTYAISHELCQPQ